MAINRVSAVALVNILLAGSIYYIIRMFTQDNPLVHCTVINGVLHIELN